MDKQKLFVRPASGLVREVSTSKGLFFSIGSAVAWETVWVTAWVSLVPTYTIAGWSSLAVGVMMSFPFLVFLLAPIYGYLVTAMPRSGGDQVFTTRIIHPAVGFLETWTLVVGVFSFMGYSLVTVIYNFSTTFSTLAVATPQPYGSYAAWLQGTTGTLVAGTVIMVLAFVVSAMPARRFYNINSLLVIVGLVLSLLVVPFLFGFNLTTFAHNFQVITGTSMSDAEQLAASKGLTIGTFTLASLGPLLGFCFLEYSGFQFTTVVSGEIKGNPSKVILTAMIGSAIVVLLIHTIYLQAYVNVLGYNFLASLSYIFYNAPASTPLIPLGQLLVAISNPQLAGLMALSTIAALLIGFSMMVCIIVSMSRIAFAWSMDRLIPTKFSEINPKTKSPLYLIAAFAVLWYIAFVGSVYGVTFITGSYIYMMLSVLYWVLPGFNAILLPHRRPDLYELIPQSMRKKVGGLHLISVIGIIWLIFIIPAFGLFMAWPIIAGASGLSSISGAVTYAISQGVGTLVAVMLVGVAIYWLSRWYNAKRGIDMSLLFKSVPPE